MKVSERISSMQDGFGIRCCFQDQLTGLVLEKVRPRLPENKCS